ncbi:TonB-dependent receptor domain-containing protein [Spongiimicrobium salis]|uniref:TonB-dependent receptor domain-containing protein n=1 Tax=Spongiimicrobium salis TaxID=1667022 RepID=UPI00374D4DD7
MFRFLLLITVILGNTFFGFAQEKITYKGVVMDKVSSEAIVTATVAGYFHNTLVDGASTNDEGIFSLRTQEKLTHFEISFIGYKTYLVYIKDIRDIENINIALEVEDYQLDEVIVQTERTTTQLKIDRKLIHLGSDLQQSGATVLEAFDQITEIQTDLGIGTISLRGSGNVRLLINGKPSALNATELLNQIPASSVEKVEIITAPSAKNQADGLSGIINVILKRNRAEGLNLILNASVGTKRHGYGIQTNYNFNLLNIRMSASRELRDMNSKQTIRQRYTNGNTRDFFTPHDFSGVVERISSGFDFFFNANNELSFEVDHTNDYHSFQNNTFYTNVTGRDDFTYTRNSSHTHKTTNFNTNYRLKMKGQEQFLEIDYHLTKNNNIQPAMDFEENEFLFNEQQNNRNTLHALALDYNLPFSESTGLETGASFNQRSLESYTEFNSATSISFEDTFQYQEDILGLYAVVQSNLDKFSWETGLRYEYFTSNSTNTSNNENITLQFSNLFPSGHISYIPNTNTSFTLGYSKRLSRPNFHHINPFQLGNQFFQWDPNPGLTPEFSDNLEFNYLYKGRKFTWSTAMFYRSITDVIQWLQTIDEAGVRTISFTNVGSRQSYGVETDMRFNVSPFWTTQLSANYYYTKVNTTVELTWNTLFSSRIHLKNSFKIGNGLSADISYQHTPKNQSEFIYTAPRNRIDLALRARFFDNRLTANLRIVDVLDINLRKNTLITADVRQEEIWRFQTQTFGVLFNLNYALFQNKGKVRNRKARNYDHPGTTD